MTGVSGRIGRAAAARALFAPALLALTMAPSPLQAQTYRAYECAGGTQFEIALFADNRAAFVQLDGKSLRLPRFVSVTGTRYRGGGITVWIKGSRATLRRAGKRIECTVR
jgi:membrane-bound inhibitor of C-type lysozyme